MSDSRDDQDLQDRLATLEAIVLLLKQTIADLEAGQAALVRVLDQMIDAVTDHDVLGAAGAALRRAAEREGFK